jgi:hypothetical protein
LQNHCNNSTSAMPSPMSAKRNGIDDDDTVMVMLSSTTAAATVL